MTPPRDPLFAQNVRLTNAIRQRDLVECVAALDAGADPNCDITHSGSGMLYRAVEIGFPEGVLLLLERGAKPDGLPLQHRPIVKAGYRGSCEVLEMLISAGADIDGSSPNGYTALHAAAQWAHAEAVAFLVSKGANVNALNDYDHTPLHSAAASVRDDTIATLRTLVEAGASPSFVPQSATVRYHTPTQHAAYHGQAASLSFFLDVCEEDPSQCTINGIPLISLPSDAVTRELIRSALILRGVELAIDCSDATRSPAIRSLSNGPL